jgi:protein-S-isoprenylcysteine O-methyltransferase Ste14
MVHSGKRESCLKATKIEFHLRTAINAVILFLGFWAPWIQGWGVGSRIPLRAWLIFKIGGLGLVSYSTAIALVVVLGALIAAKGVVFRIWGSAWLGPSTVIHGEMKGESLVADGPYRYLRNPLYVGLWAMTVALAFLMPVSGALFVLVAIPLFLLRLTLAEEAYLSEKLGAPYEEYLRAVPRLVPQFRSSLPRSGRKPQWGRAVLSELTPIGVFLAMAAFSWSYDLGLGERIIVVCFGLSLVVRALLPTVAGEGSPA